VSVFDELMKNDAPTNQSNVTDDSIPNPELLPRINREVTDGYVNRIIGSSHSKFTDKKMKNDKEAAKKMKKKGVSETINMLTEKVNQIGLSKNLQEKADKEDNSDENSDDYFWSDAE